MTAAVARQGKNWKEGMEEGAARGVGGRWRRIHPWAGGPPLPERPGYYQMALGRMEYHTQVKKKTFGARILGSYLNPSLTSISRPQFPHLSNGFNNNAS